MALLNTLLITLYIFSLPFFTTFAAPVAKFNNTLLIRDDGAELAEVLKRAPGDTASNPIDASFDIT